MDFDPVHIWQTMSIPVKLTTVFMILMSVYSVYRIVERFLVFTAASKQSYSFVLALREHLGKRQIDSAIKAAKGYNKSPVAKTMEAGLDAYKRSRDALTNEGPDEVGEFDIVDAVNRGLERVKERETSSLRKGLGGLATTASIAPFVGLFGTVLGIINAFHLIAGGGGMDKIGPGIAEALISTAFGLLIAIPAAMFFNYFTGRVEGMVVDMNDVSSEFIDYVLKEGRA
jgi:biopolymer transport protein ExbB/TolQ